MRNTADENYKKAQGIYFTFKGSDMINFKRFIACTTFTLSCVATAYAGNPASIEWVNLQIQNVQATLQTQISNIPVGINYQAGSGISITGNIISTIGYQAGSGISIVGNVISANSSAGLYIGQFYQGGIIFWLDPTASPAVHGLVADVADKPGTYVWSNNTTSATNATLDGAYQGRNSGTFNTARIIAAESAIGASSPAASICANSTVQGYTDWYLPSVQEFASMLTNQMAITQTALTRSGSALMKSNYWTSTEFSTSNAWMFYAAFYNPSSGNPKSTSGAVRCIRAF